MRLNPNAFKVLAFGDSNTFGQLSDGETWGRLPVDARWTGQLQQKLGDEYDVIEEGLGGRTTDLEAVDRVGRNGREYLLPAILTHFPLELVILMLGTNDLQRHFHRSAGDIAAAISGLIDVVTSCGVNKTGAVTATLLVAPVCIDERATGFGGGNSSSFDTSAAEESQQLVHEIRTLAKLRQVPFLDANQVAHVGRDGLHLDAMSHAPLAELVAERIRQLVPVERG